MGIKLSASQIGLDIHRKFSRVTTRDCDGKVAWRRRVEHGDRPRMRAELARWPAGTPVVREQREWLRYRMTLVRLQTGLKNRIQTFGRCGSSERRERSGVPVKRLVRQHEWIVGPIENDPARSGVRTSVTCCPGFMNCFFPLRRAPGGESEVKVRPGVVQLAEKEASRRTNRLETPA